MPEEKRVNVPKAISARRPQLKPKLGQHFLASDSFASQIVDALGDVSQNTVLEIGPGRGVLTSLLAKRARRLIAVELDRVLAAQLRLRFGTFPNVEVIEADILSIDLHSLLCPKPGLSRPAIEFKPAPARVIGNLPYYITSDILLRLFDYSKYFESLVILVQREVADRIAAKPGTRDYGLLSATAQLHARGAQLFHIPDLKYFESLVILVQREVADRIAAKPGTRDYGLLSATAQLHARVEKLFTIPPAAFAPPPKVH